MLFTKLYCFCYYVYDTLIVYGIHFMFVCISIFNKNILYLAINNNNAHKKQQQQQGQEEEERICIIIIYINII